MEMQASSRDPNAPRCHQMVDSDHRDVSRKAITLYSDGTSGRGIGSGISGGRGSSPNKSGEGMGSLLEAGWNDALTFATPGRGRLGPRRSDGSSGVAERRRMRLGQRTPKRTPNGYWRGVEG
jgi:hypothetical protein